VELFQAINGTEAAVKNLRSIKKYAEAAPDWTSLNGCFWNDAVRVSDLDGVVHHQASGYGLVFEWKRRGFEFEPYDGQLRTLQGLAATGLFTCFFITGPPQPESLIDRVIVFTKDAHKPGRVLDGWGWGNLQNFCREWSRRAEKARRQTVASLITFSEIAWGSK
jgi:hypothetical protein